MRKKFAILIIGLMLINILSFIKPVQANPAAVLMGPGVYYAIAGGLTACGLYAADSEALQYAVQDYWNKQQAYNREQWRKAVQYGVITGKIIINANTIQSILDYLANNFVSGENYVANGSVDIPSNITYPDNIQVVINDAEIVATLSNGSVLLCRDIVHDGYYNVNGVSIPRYVHYFDLIYEGNTRAWGQSHYWHRYLNIVTLYSASSSCPPPNITDVGANFITLVYQTMMNYGEIVTAEKTTNIDFRELGSIIGQTIYFNYVGDAAGFGTALSPEQEVKVPCPPVPEIDWPDSWIDDLERWMNETDNQSIDDETTIQEGEDDWDWYVDKDTGEIYKRRKGEGPRHDDDRKIGFPVPVPEPNVPDDLPDINNPDETTIDYPPETEIINNPDGTTTEKTIERSDTTRKFYDPITKKWKETTTTTTTTTETTLGPDGLPLGPPVVTVTTGPPTTVTTNPPTDDTGIDWQPLKKGASTITRKFPFSLPWDLYNSFKQLDGGSWDGKLDINIDTKLADFVFNIDLGMFDAIRNIVKKIELLIFDVGLILATRRLMGGGV